MIFLHFLVIVVKKVVRLAYHVANLREVHAVNAWACQDDLSRELTDLQDPAVLGVYPSQCGLNALNVLLVQAEIWQDADDLVLALTQLLSVRNVVVWFVREVAALVGVVTVLAAQVEQFHDEFVPVFV